MTLMGGNRIRTLPYIRNANTHLQHTTQENENHKCIAIVEFGLYVKSLEGFAGRIRIHGLLRIYSHPVSCSESKAGVIIGLT